MKLWLEITCIYVNCVLLSLSSILFALNHVRIRMRADGVKSWQESLACYAFVAPFGLFPLGAAIQAQLHQTILTTPASLLIAAVFVAYPFAISIKMFFLGDKGRIF